MREHHYPKIELMTSKLRGQKENVTGLGKSTLDSSNREPVICVIRIKGVVKPNVRVVVRPSEHKSTSRLYSL